MHPLTLHGWSVQDVNGQRPVQLIVTGYQEKEEKLALDTSCDNVGQWSRGGHFTCFRQHASLLQTMRYEIGISPGMRARTHANTHTHTRMCAFKCMHRETKHTTTKNKFGHTACCHHRKQAQLPEVKFQWLPAEMTIDHSWLLCTRTWSHDARHITGYPTSKIFHSPMPRRGSKLTGGSSSCLFSCFKYFTCHFQASTCLFSQWHQHFSTMFRMKKYASARADLHCDQRKNDHCWWILIGAQLNSES